MRQGGRLTRACARYDEKRSVAVEARFTLLGVQFGQDRVDGGLALVVGVAGGEQLSQPPVCLDVPVYG